MSTEKDRVIQRAQRVSRRIATHVLEHPNEYDDSSRKQAIDWLNSHPGEGLSETDKKP